MASTALFAQEHHWTPVTSNETMSATSVVLIDGTEQDNPQLEIGVFCVEDGTCGSSCFPNTSPLFGHRIYSLAWYGQTGKNYTFKLYDHSLQKELDVTGPVIPFVNGQRLGNPRNPYQLTFTSNASGYTLEIDPYTSNKDNYYLIASPVGAIEAKDVQGLRTPSFDFYSFNQSAVLEWINLRDDETFELQPGEGYLYANNTGTDLTFNGTPTTEETVSVTLTYATADEGLDFPDWNLVGNPFEVDATLDQPFYAMEGGVIVPKDADAELPAMNGAFVVGSADVTEVTFSRQAQTGDKAPMLALNLTEAGKLVDRAIVSFGQGRQLPKLQLFSNSKVYIPQDGNDYALVRSEGIGEMPVSFKAESNGSYSLTLSSENAEFAYLHLIDNLTGADQDLLANPSYSFSANTTDYASRFRLVFATGNDEDSFAFFSNGSLFVNNEGNATLQVVDVTGRILKSESINGCASVSFDAAPGVYMVRLLNGDNMKVQKVVK
jgi:hypothetical protein